MDERVYSKQKIFFILFIQVLRPSCNSELVYCPAIDTCCSSNNQFLSELCNEGNCFCSSTSVCQNLTQQKDCSLNCPSGKISLKNRYRIVYNSTLDVQSGYNLKLLTSDSLFEYLPGDVLGWIKTDTSATLVIDPREGEFNVLPDVTKVPESLLIYLSTQQQSTKQVGTVLMAGIASKPSEFLSTLTATRSGTYNVTFIFETPSGEKLTATHSVFALNPIGNVSFNADKASGSCTIWGAVNESLNVSLFVSSGTRPKVLWLVQNRSIATNPYLLFGDQEKIEVTQNFTFSSIGKYFLTVVVSNPLSGKIVHSDIVILEKITGLSGELKFGNETAYQGIIAELIASVATGTNVTFKWYFGDGSKTKVTTQGTTKHRYKKEGLVTTVVEAVNTISSENISIQINLTNPVKMDLPQYGVKGSPVNITCSLLDGFTDDYQVVFEMDDSSIISTKCSTIQYTFSTGLHNISCYIEVDVVVITTNATLYVLEPITGLKIIGLPPVKLGETRLVEANITTGNNVSYLWQLLGQSYDAYLTNVRPINFSSPGEIKISVNASNAISMHYAETLVTVQVPLGVLTVSASSNPARSNTNITLYINKTSGTFVSYTVNVSNFYSQDLGSSPTFTCSFREGLHDIVVHASNFISQSNVTYRITVQDPLVHPIDISCPSVFGKGGVCAVEANRTLPFRATVNYATNVTFLWSCNDSGSQKITDENPSVEKPYVMSTTACFFPRAEKYNVSVVAENDVSSTRKWLYVYSLEKITGFSFVIPIVVAVNETIQLQIRLSKGSNVTFWFDVGDKRALTITSLTKKLKYANPGNFLVKGRAENVLGNKTYSRVLAVQEKIKSIHFTKDIPFIRVFQKMSINWEIKGGTNVTTLISWGDGSHENVSNISCQYREPDSTYSCEESHIFTNAGSYVVKLTAQNGVSSKRVNRTVSVQDPIEGLSITFPSQKYWNTFVYKEIAITTQITKGTEVEYQFNLGDGRTLNTSTSAVSIKYYSEGNYTLSIIARNGISSNSTSGSLIFVRTPPVPEPVRGLSLSAENTVLGTPTKLEVSYETGALFTCTISFGQGLDNKELTEAQVNKPIPYHYAKCGRYEIILTCKNTHGDRMAKTYVFVDEKIEQFHLNSSSIKALFHSTVSIDLAWKNGSNVTIVAFKNGGPFVEPVVDNNGRVGSVSFSSNYFESPGYYTVYVNASNSVSFVQEVGTVHLIERISNTKVLVNPFVSVNYQLFAYLFYEEGSDINVKWSFGDGNSSSRTNCTRQQTCSEGYHYSKPGIYNIIVEAENEYSKRNSSAKVEIQYPIFGWTFSANNVSEKNSPSIVSLRHNTSFPFPTKACYEIKFGNESKTRKNLTGNALVMESHTFAKAGCHLTVVTIKNSVSTVVLSTSVDVRGEIRDPKLTAESLGSEKLSTGTLPIEYPVRFKSNLENSCLKYNWTISNESNVFHFNNSGIFEYTFATAGIYNISLTAYDTKMERFAELTVRVDRSVTGLFFSSDGVAKVNDSVNFVVLCVTLGSTTSFEIDYGDATAKHILPPLINITQDFRNDYQKLNVPFNPEGFYGVIFNHTYLKNGTYVVRVNVTGSANNQSLTNEVVIAKAPCQLPGIKIIGGSQEFKSAPEIPYGIQYTFFSDVSANCKDIITVLDFSWTVYQADAYLLKKTGSSLPPRKDLKVA